MTKTPKLLTVLCFSLLLGTTCHASAAQLQYGCSQPPLEVKFAITDKHYSGEVHCGNLFLQSDIPKAPVVQWKSADAQKLYTLLMVDFDGNAKGSWPDSVSSGENSPVRHWIVGNIPGSQLRTTGYIESNGASTDKSVSIVQAYRAPHIPMVSDRFGIFLFQQAKKLDFNAITGDVINFDCAGFLSEYKLGKPAASNYFVGIYTSESPFSGKTFHGNDVSGTWHKDYGKGTLTPAP